MPTIVAKADNLDELNRNYAQTPLKGPVFLNSVPKCGTHLLRNIVRMFVPVEQQYHKTYVQHAVLGQHMAAFNPATPMLSWGHLFFSDAAAIVAARNTKGPARSRPLRLGPRARALLSIRHVSGLDRTPERRPRNGGRSPQHDDFRRS